ESRIRIPEWHDVPRSEVILVRPRGKSRRGLESAQIYVLGSGARLQRRNDLLRPGVERAVVLAQPRQPLLHLGEQGVRPGGVAGTTVVLDEQPPRLPGIGLH